MIDWWVTSSCRSTGVCPQGRPLTRGHAKLSCCCSLLCTLDQNSLQKPCKHSLAAPDWTSTTHGPQLGYFKPGQHGGSFGNRSPVLQNVHSNVFWGEERAMQLQDLPSFYFDFVCFNFCCVSRVSWGVAMDATNLHTVARIQLNANDERVSWDAQSFSYFEYICWKYFSMSYCDYTPQVPAASALHLEQYITRWCKEPHNQQHYLFFYSRGHGTTYLTPNPPSQFPASI